MVSMAENLLQAMLMLYKKSRSGSNFFCGHCVFALGVYVLTVQLWAKREDIPNILASDISCPDELFNP